MKNIIFDIGGVILHWDMDELLDEFANNEEERKFIYNNIYDTKEWAKEGIIDIGYITQYDFIKIIQDKTNHTNDSLIEDFILNYYKLFYIIDDVINLMKKLKDKGYKIYVLSNINDYITERIDMKRILEYTDGYILSYQVHKVKPNIDIFEELLNKYNINPNESLIIDDNADNLKTANKLGIKGRNIIKNSYEDILKLLEEYDVVI